MGECDTHQLAAVQLRSAFRQEELVRDEDTLFGQIAVMRLLRRHLAERHGRFHIFHGLAEHEAEGIRFLRGAEALPDALCAGWNRREHLADESRHMRYFAGLAGRESAEGRIAPLPLPPLSDSERSVFENPQNFLVNLYVAELFSAAYLRALRKALPEKESKAMAKVIDHALRDEQKHAGWVGSAIAAEWDEALRVRMRRHWDELELGLLEDLIVPEPGAGPSDRPAILQ